jgi:hypothetical protein
MAFLCVFQHGKSKRQKHIKYKSIEKKSPKNEGSIVSNNPPSWLSSPFGFMFYRVFGPGFLFAELSKIPQK